jgi:hypothetical protein
MGMKFRIIAGLVCVFATGILRGSPLDDKIKAFEDAVKASPPVVDKATPGINRFGRTLTIDDLNLTIQQSNNPAQIEAIVGQLMATHPSPEVQKAGEDIIQELETERKARTDAFEAKATDVLAAVHDALVQAKKPSDLDQILKDLQALQPAPGSPGEETSPAIATKINLTFQYVTQWQDYLSGMNSGNKQQAVDSLCAILNANNASIESPLILPRSQLLDLVVEARGGNLNLPPAASNNPSSPAEDPEALFSKVKKPTDFIGILPELSKIAPAGIILSMDWKRLADLDKARADVVAGLPVSLSFSYVYQGATWSESISRIIAMEYLVILPYYFGTDISDPPKANETVVEYLDRLTISASANANLALLQRVIMVKMAMVHPLIENYLLPPFDPATASGTMQFLGGLSQDNGGQYEAAVVSYENALKNPDGILPSKIVGERLAAIKESHPEEFQKGLTTFLAPPPASPFPGMPGWQPPGFANRNNYITVPAIPMNISIPARASASAPATNASPVNTPESTK